jgi:excisionase family DNA binding protein
MSDKTTALAYTVEVRVINNYFLISSPDFDLRISAGYLFAQTGTPEKVTTHGIGKCVLKVFQEIQTRLDKGIKSVKTIYGALMGIGEVAQALGVSTSSVRRLIDCGKLEAVRTGGGHRRITAVSFKRYIEEVH